MTQTLNLTIDGRAAQCAPGATVYDVAVAHGVYIPTLCHHKKLCTRGACRICMVEVEGLRTLVPSCAYPAAKGMVVHTDTPKVKEARRFVLDLILAEGHHDCLVCPADGDCEIQRVAFRTGYGEMPKYPARPEWPVDESHPFVRFDPNRCILCGRCVAGCQEVQVNGVLSVGFRSGKTKIVADQDQRLADSSCVACGECIQSCPTGALTEKKSRFTAKRAQVDRTRTVCSYCGVGWSARTARRSPWSGTRRWTWRPASCGGSGSGTARTPWPSWPPRSARTRRTS